MILGAISIIYNNLKKSLRLGLMSILKIKN
jgi:hypothetical protein